MGGLAQNSTVAVSGEAVNLMYFAVSTKTLHFFNFTGYIPMGTYKSLSCKLANSVTSYPQAEARNKIHLLGGTGSPC